MGILEGAKDQLRVATRDAGYVAVGSKADLTAPKSDFRYTPESGLKTDIAPCPKSAKTGSQRTLLDHLVSAGEEGR
jgi:hypothetical protein